MEPGVPGLVGLRPSYIAAQLTRWRVGERRAAEPDCMHRIATRLTESDIAAVAAYIAQQDTPRDPSPESANFVRMPMACGSHAEVKRLAVVFAIIVAIGGRRGVDALAPRLPADGPARPPPPANATTQVIARGEYLARAGDCVACHTEPTGKPFAGGRADADALRRHSTCPTSRPTTRPASGVGPPTSSTG